MLAKTLLIIIIFFSFSFSSLVFGSVQPITSGGNWNNNGINQANMKTTQSNIVNNLTPDQKMTISAMSPNNPAFLADGKLNPKGPLADGKNGAITKAAQKISNINKSKIDSKTDISKTSFVIEVGDISPGGTGSIAKGDSKQTAKNILQKIIDNLMVAFGVLALLVMTIGGGYMIMYHGQDELLSKGKSIFNSGLIALVVALSAGILVKLVAYLLY